MCQHSKHQLFNRAIGAVEVRAYVVIDDDADQSFMTKAEVQKVEHGILMPFGTVVEVRKNNHVIGIGSLWGSWVTGGPYDPYLRTVAREMLPDAVADARKTLGLTA